VTHHQALQAAGPLMQSRQAHQLALDLLPVRQRINQKAGVTIHGDNEVALATLERALTLPGGQNHPAFVIERDSAGTTKHDFGTGAQSPISPHFLPLGATIETADVECQRRIEENFMYCQ
jgi:hypothetical protein